MAKKDIEIPFGAHDSELDGFEYTIPEGYEAEIKDGKVVVRKTESEDERIRKEMIFYFQEEIPQCSIQEHADKMKEFIAWLEKQGEQKDILEDAILDSNEDGLIADIIRYKREKQGEQKPAWSEEDEKILNLIIGRLHSHKNVEAEEYDKDYHWLKSLKERVKPQSKQEWSEEGWTMQDEEELQIALDTLVKAGQHSSAKWLKNVCLRPQPTWKPSDEQIEALLKLEEMHVLEHEKNQENAHLYMMVKSIREQLLKLREEQL